jgi:NAD(P)H-dependent FMN reductase
MRIEIISGSPRKNSITHRVALHLAKHLTNSTDHEVNLIDVRDWDLPFVQAVYTCVDKTPEPFKALSERIFNADAFILVSPEYNGSYSPALKNLLDHYPKQHHKPFGIVTASPGALGGIRGALEMQSLVSALFGIFSPYMLLVGGVEKKFDAEGNLLDENFHHSIHNFESEFLWLAERLVKEHVAV